MTSVVVSRAFDWYVLSYDGSYSATCTGINNLYDTNDCYWESPRYYHESFCVQKSEKCYTLVIGGSRGMLDASEETNLSPMTTLKVWLNQQIVEDMESAEFYSMVLDAQSSDSSGGCQNAVPLGQEMNSANETLEAFIFRPDIARYSLDTVPNVTWTLWHASNSQDVAFHRGMTNPLDRALQYYKISLPTSACIRFRLPNSRYPEDISYQLTFGTLYGQRSHQSIEEEGGEPVLPATEYIGTGCADVICRSDQTFLLVKWTTAPRPTFAWNSTSTMEFRLFERGRVRADDLPPEHPYPDKAVELFSRRLYPNETYRYITCIDDLSDEKDRCLAFGIDDHPFDNGNVNDYTLYFNGELMPQEDTGNCNEDLVGSYCSWYKVIPLAGRCKVGLSKRAVAAMSGLFPLLGVILVGLLIYGLRLAVERGKGHRRAQRILIDRTRQTKL